MKKTTYKLSELTGEAYDSAYVNFCVKIFKIANYSKADLSKQAPYHFAETEELSDTIGCLYDENGELLTELETLRTTNRNWIEEARKFYG